MTTVAEFIAYLQTLPEDSKVEVVDGAYTRTRSRVDLILPTEEDVYSSETCWYDNIDRVLKLGDY